MPYKVKEHSDSELCVIVKSLVKNNFDLLSTLIQVVVDSPTFSILTILHLLNLVLVNNTFLVV